MKAIRSCLIKYSATAIMLMLSGFVYALNTQVTLQADTDITPSNSELVTFGLPIAKGEVNNISEIKVSISGQEVAAFVEAGLRYHWDDNSIRSVTIQLQNVDMSAGNLTVTVTDAGATVARLSEVSHATGWATAGANKNNLPYPRIFALHDKAYLAQSGLIPPYTPAPDVSDAFEQYQIAQFNNNFGALNYSTSTAGNWLFDRSSAMFKVYMTTGRVEFLKEAFLSKQFYFQYVKNDGTEPKAAGGDGCWTYGGVACADGKYIAPQQAKLALALVGDESQWDDSLIVKMALQADLGWNQYATRDPFDSENEGFTERGAGLAGLAEVVAYEMTGDATILSHLNQRISSLKDMQQTEKTWDVANGWVPKSGGFTHNIGVHEGEYNEGNAPLGDTNERGFSAWMSENIADFLWQAYWLTGNQDAPEMLRLLANAVDNYGFTSVYNASTGQYDQLSEFQLLPDPIRAQGCNTTRLDTALVYMASAFADDATRTSGDWYPYYSDNHNIEVVLILASGYYFETDEAKKTQLQTRIAKLIDGWSNTNCANVFSNVYRLFNWQHRSNSVRTWGWVAQQSGIEVVAPLKSLPLSPGGFFAAAVSSGSTGGSTGGSAGGTETGGSTGGSTGGTETGGSTGGSTGGTETGGSTGGSTGGTGSGASTGGSETGGSTGDGNTGASVTALVYVATAACAEGNDPHWQCDAKWKSYNDVSTSDYIAICPGAEGASYADCEGSDKFIPSSAVQATDGLFVCPDGTALGGGRNACTGTKYVRTANLGDIDSVVATAPSAPVDSVEVGAATPETSNTGILTFSDVTLNVIPDMVTGQSPVVAPFEADVAHLNGDGCLDILITSHGTDDPDGIYIQNNVGGVCQGTYKYLQNNYSATGPASRRITSWTMLLDLDGDSDTDIIGGDVDGNPSLAALLDSNGSTYTGVTGCLYNVDRCLPIDVNGDGKLELVSAPLVGVAFNDDVLNVNTGTGIFGSIYSWPDRNVMFAPDWANISSPNLTRAWASFLVFDANNDSYPDLVHPQLNMIFFNGPNGMSSTPVIGNFTASASMFNTSYATDADQHSNSHQQLTIDYDNDGDLDIFKIRVNKGGNNAIDLADADGDGDGIWLLRNDGNGNFTDVSTTELSGLSLNSLTYQTTYAGLGAGDFNNDGLTDIRADWLTGGGFDAPCGIILNGGTGKWSKEAIPCANVLSTADGRIAASGGASKTVVTQGDYDGDGRLDLISSNAQRSATKDTLAVWRNTGSYNNNWLSFVVSGAPTNEGFHTRVMIKAADSSTILCTREIYIAQQYGSAQEHCGLGNNSNVDIDMQLPNGGALVQFRNISVNRNISLSASGQVQTWNLGSSKP